MDEVQLIAEFRKSRSEDAFASLVRRHVDFVYATALRQVGDSGLAEEITQDVFVVLARKAGSLGRYKTIAGWLYQTTLNRVRQRLRSELRRQRREGIAAELQANAVEGQSIWEPLVPLLDEGLGAMDERDRLALLLHCLEGRGFREVGEALGLGEDAARKRVNRALEDVLSGMGLGVLFAETETATHGYVLAPAEAQEIARLLSETEGVDRISAPRVTMVDGKQARISDLGPNRGVRGRRIGVSVNLIPHISPDGQTVDLTVLAGMGERNIEPPAVDNLVRP